MKFAAHLLAAASAFAGLASAEVLKAENADPSVPYAELVRRATTSASGSVNPATASCFNLAATAIPACGLQLLLSAATQYSCAQTDLGCQCAHYTSIQSQIFSPVLSACGHQTALEVVKGANIACGCVSNGGSIPASITTTTAGVNPFGNQLCVDYGLAIPTCGTPLLKSYAKTIGGCGEFDFECQCAYITPIQNVASTPIINACGTTTALQVLSRANDLCSCITANNKGITGGVATVVPTVTLSAPAPNFTPSNPFTGGLLSIFAGLLALW